jgi:hypothetical protein
MADTLVRAWIERLQGRLRPTPMPFSQAYSLLLPGRGLVAGPARLLADFGLEPGERVLEIGPGIGYYSGALVRRVGASGRLVCLDLRAAGFVEERSRGVLWYTSTWRRPA